MFESGQMMYGIAAKGLETPRSRLRPMMSPTMDHRVESDGVVVNRTMTLGRLFSSKCIPHRGANPVNAEARAESPDSRFVRSDVNELAKQTAFDSAQHPIPSRSSPG